MPKYDEAFWRRELKGQAFGPLMGSLMRLVENQEQKVTAQLTDSLEEHAVLETLLERSKPVSPHPRIERFDYLLRTPWRYPPLKWGSRFGRRHEPSLFYGALSRAALFAEAAYYRLLFLEGMATPFKDRVISQFTVFEAAWRGERSADLTQSPFLNYERSLRNKSRYAACQALGSVLREKDVMAVVYWSARAVGRESNVGLFSPEALRSRKHRNPRRGLCETHYEQVSFRIDGELLVLPRKQFLVRGELPMPA